MLQAIMESSLLNFCFKTYRKRKLQLFQYLTSTEIFFKETFRYNSGSAIENENQLD